MKKLNVFIIMVSYIICAGSFLQRVNGQDKTISDQERSQKFQQAIINQKKAMAEQEKAKEESAGILKEKQFNLEEALNDIRMEVEAKAKEGGGFRIDRKRPSESLHLMDPFILSMQGDRSFYGHSAGDSERTTWDYSRSVKENTFSKDYTFDVDKTVNTVVMSVMGDCKSGEIRIRIIMPNGKNYSEILIDESGNLNWRKSFSISETENQDKTGEWKFQIVSSKATGYFKISLQTY
jgi:hypothetical protein